jgi:two-component system sensor histidine kinase KdpD
VVRDTGPGVPEGLDVFARFVRGGAGGIGLGLSIVRGLVETHGGTVTASNDGGCVVMVSLAGGAAPRAELPVGAEVS